MRAIRNRVVHVYFDVDPDILWDTVHNDLPKLADGSVIERDVGPLLVGPVFEAVRDNPDVFRAAKVAAGTVVWPKGADLCPDVLIWGGPPREGSAPDRLALPTHAG